MDIQSSSDEYRVFVRGNLVGVIRNIGGNLFTTGKGMGTLTQCIAQIRAEFV